MGANSLRTRRSSSTKLNESTTTQEKKVFYFNRPFLSFHCLIFCWRKMPNLLVSADFVWAITRKTRLVIRRKCFIALNAAIQVEIFVFNDRNQH